MKLLWLFVVFFIPAIYSLLSLAQTETGAVSGTVTDPTGNLLQEASITLTSTATRTTRSSVSNAEGFYIITNVQPGLYELGIAAPGFSTLTRQVEITVASHIRGDAQLKVAGAKTSVEVLGEGGVQVETQTQTLSQVVTGKQVTELPTLTRNPYDLVAITGNISTEDPTGRGVRVAINGQRAASTNVTLDGGENMDVFAANVGQSVPLDSVQEFRLSHSNFTAESGRASGGVVDVATKSGTDQFHGTAYHFNRISALASNDYFNNANDIPRGVFVRNQFGFSLGGPVLKDKLFFFVSTEWTRVRSNAQQIALVPTPQFIAAAAPNTQQYMNMFGTLSTPINGPVFTKADLVNAGEISPDPNSSLDLLPDSTPVFGQVAFSVPFDAGGGSPSNSYSLVARIDYNLSKNTTLNAHFALESVDIFPGSVSFSPYAGYNTGTNTLNHNIQLSLTHVFSTALVSQSKIVFNRLYTEDPLGTSPRATPTLFSAGFPFGLSIALPGYGALINDAFFGGPQSLLQLHQDVNMVHGKHQLRLGGEYIYIRDNRTFGAFEEGQETLGFTETNSLENFLDGKLQRFEVAIDPHGKFPCVTNLDTTPIQTPDCTINLPVSSPDFSRSNRYNDFAVYAQDSWRAQRTFTVNLGVRWEYYGIQHNKNSNLDSNFYPAPASNFADQIRNGRVFTVPMSPIGGLSQPRYGDVAPRVGFAWDLFGNGKSSLRGGYGIGYERNFGNVTFNII